MWKNLGAKSRKDGARGFNKGNPGRSDRRLLVGNRRPCPDQQSPTACVDKVRFLFLFF
jgi:hypothetical protein